LPCTSPSFLFLCLFLFVPLVKGGQPRLVGAGGFLLALLLCTSGCITPPCTGVAAFGNLGSEVNTPFDDYAPVLLDTATLVFTSNRVLPGRGGLQEHYSVVRPTYLYFSMRLTASWDLAQPYPVILDQRDLEAATYSPAPEGSPFNTVAYVSACGGANSIGGCDIYAVTRGAKTSLVDLGPAFNSKEWDGQPFVTPDGSRLYFASDRPGGFGKSDIWIADRLPSGSWGAPYNAGPAINTSEDELSPFFDAATGRLYFAAVTTNSGRDVFVLDSGSTGRRVLPSPYNSEADDFSPYLSGGLLYLASNRSGGCGGYDLYAFPVDAELKR
jgi:hypothetical protein